MFTIILRWLGLPPDDGWRFDGPRMRRKLDNGGYEYRPMSADEVEMVRIVGEAWPGV